MTLLNSGYHCHGSPYIIAVQPRPVTVLDQWAGGCQANNPQQCWNGGGREENAKLCHFIWWLTQSLLFTGTTEICIFLPSPLPPSPLLSHLCSSSPPLRTPLHSHNPRCLWQHCMKWILPHPAAMILISLLPLLSSFLSLSLVSLHSPLHWFNLSLWARQLGVITHAAHTQWCKHTHTHTH